MSDRARELIEMLALRPHPEGGHYREIFRSMDRVEAPIGERDASTQIYFVLAAGEHSRWHVVRSDEIWHAYEGDPLELITYDTATTAIERVRLGRLDDGAQPVHVVPARVWQAARPLGEYALVGCTVAPGFDFADFRFVADVEGHETPFASALSAYRALL